MRRMAIGLLAFFVWAAAACASECRVLTPADDVAGIVEAAKAGDVIELSPGVYHTHLIVRAAITLRGQPGAVIDAGGKGSGITVRMPEAVVENLTVQNYGANLYERDAGVRVTDGADQVTIRGMTLKGPGFGIRADRLMRIVIENNTIEGRRHMHVLDRGDGVYLNYVRYPKLTGNSVRNVRDGFYFENVDGSVSRGNFFTGAQYGIHWMYTRDDSAFDNVAAGVIGGFALMSSKRIHFENNTSKQSVEFGILLNVCEGCTVRSNLVEGVHNPKGKAALDTEGKGLFIYGPGASRVEGNAFTGADIGIGVALGGEKTIVTENVFDKNTIQVRYVGKAPLEWSENGRGNYWSTFMSWDADGNGIADTPYQPNDSLDRIFWIYPEARFLMQSPVTALLRWFAARLEIDRGKGVTDSHPLMTAPVVKGAAQ